VTWWGGSDLQHSVCAFVDYSFCLCWCGFNCQDLWGAAEILFATLNPPSGRASVALRAFG
jgi:hypothetical protein